MLSSITPLGEWGRANRWSVTVTAHLIGSALSGSAIGALFGVVGGLLPLQIGAVSVGALVAVATFCAVAIGIETGAVPALPTWHRQVDEDWLHRYRGWVYGFGYGAQLGVGVVTIVTSPLVYVVLALALLTGSPLWGALVGLSFGLCRAAPVLATRGITTPGRLGTAHRRLDRLAPAGRRAAAAMSAVVVIAAGGQLAVLAGAG